ncbi:lytic transglycosylase domain-containing protein [Burkholderia territorii]|uniref:lytic transglycosylase domain-containing protein n=1 Tax=Burkholderia territorii TaxID=1503055 RepID=UPI0018C51CB7|nr:lytic transglycosylase domain-containing protein [Burkholderia territorii]
MADNQAAQPVEDTGPPPWERVWNDVKDGASKAFNNITSLVAAPSEQMPWQMDFSAQRPAPPSVILPKAPSQPSVAPTDLFQRLVNTESRGKHTDASGNLLTSSAGAQGITQVMPKTGSNPGYGVTPIQNNSEAEYLRFGKDYLNAMIKNFGGDVRKAVAAYNYGPGAVDRAVAKAKKIGGDWLAHTPLETQKYVQRIVGG